MVVQKDMHSSPARNPKLQLTAAQVDRRMLDSTKKDTYVQSANEALTRRGKKGEMHLE